VKVALILLLVLSLMVVGGCAADVDTGADTTSGEVTQAEALEEVDNSLISDMDDVEIGEMI